MKSVFFLFAFLMLSAIAFAQGEIYGTVTDKDGVFPGVSVKVTQGGILKGGTITDDDGRFSVKPLPAGRYDVEFKVQSYKTKIIKSVVVSSGGERKLDVKMEEDVNNLNTVDVVAFRKPVIDIVKTVGAQTLERQPGTDLNNVGSLSSNVYQQRSGSAISIGGDRSNGTVYMTDASSVSGGLKDIPEGRRIPSNNESYNKVVENDFMNVKANPLSTISVDVDHASYANVRSYINGGSLPPADAVRIEEMVNYFTYSYKKPKTEDPIRMNTEVTDCPWNKNNLLLRIGLQAKVIATDDLPAANIVFLIDVSGSMDAPNKLPLLKEAFKLLIDQLREQDKVSIVVYAGNSGLALAPTSGANKSVIKEVLDRLSAGGSTAGGQGIELAYKIAGENFIKGGNNRVVLATDGDFNVGISNDNDLEKLIVSKRDKGIFLSCLGFGNGNYKDSKMETLADKGNGNYNYIDNIKEANKTLVKEFGGTIFTIAKDVKTQIEFNPSQVKSYRLLGYENRVLNTEDFKDDKKDAAEMGSGHSVTILYELVPLTNSSSDIRPVDKLKYQDVQLRDNDVYRDELATIKFRYKEPEGKKSKELDHIVKVAVRDMDLTTEDTKFASAVALFGMILSDSKYKKEGSFETVLKMATEGAGEDKDGYRSEFIELVKKANALSKSR